MRAKKDISNGVKKKFKPPHQKFGGGGKPKEKKDIAKEDYNLPTASSHSPKGERAPLKSLEDLPLVGGLFKGLEKFIDLAEKVEEAGGEIKKMGEIKGLGGKTKGIYGFSIRTGIGERPRIQTFGNIRPTKVREAKPKIKITEEREPIVDIFDEKDHILIIVELPGMRKESIKLTLHPVKPRKAGAKQLNRVSGDILTLKAHSAGSRQTGKEKRKYYKEILLPAKVDICTKKVSYKNGLLEVKIKKAKIK